MSDERSRRAKELFEAAVDAAPENREQVVVAGADGDHELEAEVRELLALYESPGRFLEGAAADHVGLASRVVFAANDRVAEFRIEGVLGSGGGAVVYEATQERPRRRVALKVLDPVTTGAFAERLGDEAETLGRLRHDGIAHVYAAGVLQRDGYGLPWIAMELIDGARDIVGHAAEARLGVRQRVALLVRVAKAVEHAHGRGVIHRDLKPGNVLVTADGRPKVVDFGIAAEIGESRSEIAGTPAYMAPEQLDPDTDDVDVRVDVHGLGVVLYEMLAGALPRQVGDILTTRALRDALAAPVTPLTESADVPADLAAAVHRALAAEREARYPSLGSFRRDLERWLASEPVIAFAGGGAYRLAKFVRRRRAAAAMIGAAVVAALAIVGASLRVAYVSAEGRRRVEFHSYIANVSAAAAALRTHDARDARAHLLSAPSGYRDWEWRHLWAWTDGSTDRVSWGGRNMRHGAVSGDGQRLAAAAPFGVPPESVVGLWDAAGRLLTTIDLDCREFSVALSADHGRLAIGGETGLVALFDGESGAHLRSSTPHDDVLNDLCFSPDGTRLATASTDRRVLLLDAETLAVEHSLGHDDRAISLAFSSDGTRLFSGGRDGVVRVWDVETGERLRAWKCHESSVEGLAPSPDGRRLATVARDQTVALWDLEGERRIQTSFDHSSNVRDVVYAPDGSWFASAGWDRTIRIWDGASGAKRGVLVGHEGRVHGLATTPDTRELVSFSEDGTWRRWRVERAGVTRVDAPRDWVTALAVDGASASAGVATRSGLVHRFDLDSGAALAEPVSMAEGSIGDLWFAPGGRLVACGKRVRVRRLDRGEPEEWSASQGAYFGAPLGGDRFLLLASGLTDAGRESQLLELNLRSRAIALRFTLPDRAWAMSRDPSSGRVFLGTDTGEVLSLSPGLDRIVARVRFHEDDVTDVACSASGEWLVTSSRDGTACILRAAGLTLHRRLVGHDGAVTAALFLPGATRAVTASMDGTVRLWDVGSGALVLVLHDVGYAVGALAASPDGTYLLGGGGADEDLLSNVCVWVAPPVVVNGE